MNPYAIQSFGGRPLHYRLDGNHQPVPCSPVEWSRLIENLAERRVAYTEIGECWVSTVFLGLDHNYSGKGPPILFETMVFGPPTGERTIIGTPELAPSPLGEIQERYATWTEALIGHKRHVEKLRSAIAKIEALKDIGHARTKA